MQKKKKSFQFSVSESQSFCFLHISCCDETLSVISVLYWKKSVFLLVLSVSVSHNLAVAVFLWSQWNLKWWCLKKKQQQKNNLQWKSELDVGVSIFPLT